VRAFRYRLQSALRRAERAEQARQIELSQAEERARRAGQRLARLRRSVTCVMARFREIVERGAGGQGPGMAGDELLPYGRELARVEALLAQAQEWQRDLESKVEAARQRVMEAMQERKMLERHREILAERHTKAERAKESKRLDDVANMRFALRDPEGPFPFRVRGAGGGREPEAGGQI